MSATRKCPQCWRDKPYPSGFLGAKGKPIRWCTSCRANYRGWDKKTPADRAAIPRTGVPVLPELRVTFVASSKNEKLGGIPASTTSRNTCPPSCSFYDGGCYALYGKTAHHWRTTGSNGGTWEELLEHVRALPAAQLWRHNVAGDLPGAGESLDRIRLFELIDANAGRRGFTFTHKRGGPWGHAAIADANNSGFTINLSADTLAQADALAELAIGPVAVVLPSDAPDRLKTPADRRVVVCPAETEGLTCVECQLCANPMRKAIVGFRAHGQSKRLVSELVRARRTVVSS